MPTVMEMLVTVEVTTVVVAAETMVMVVAHDGGVDMVVMGSGAWGLEMVTSIMVGWNEIE